MPKMVPDPYIPGAMVRESLAEVAPSERMAHAVHQQMAANVDPEAQKVARGELAADVAAAMGAKP